MQATQNIVTSMCNGVLDSSSKETTYEIDDYMFIEFGENNNELILDTVIGAQAMIICKHFAKENRLVNLREVVYSNFFGSHHFRLSFQDEQSASDALVGFKTYYDLEICSIKNMFCGGNSSVIIYSL